LPHGFCLAFFPAAFIIPPWFWVAVRASPGTKTKEEKRRLNTLNKRLERDRKRNLAADED
jgi:hypothetical protein